MIGFEWGALAGVICCLAMKWVFASRLAGLRREMDREREACREAKQTYEKARGGRVFLASEKKRLKGQVASAQHSLASLRTDYKNLKEQAVKENSERLRQQAMLGQQETSN